MYFTIISVILSSIISVILSDKIINGINILFVKFRVYYNFNVDGLWYSTYITGVRNNKIEHKEKILLKRRFSTVYGYLIDENNDCRRLFLNRGPIRLKGTINDNKYFTGIWYHPKITNRYHGAFQLLISPSTTEMHGQWIGYSESKNIINNGEWVLEKPDN